MPWWTWLTVGFFLAVVVGGAIGSAVWALRLWGAVRSLGGSATSVLADLERTAAEVERRAASLANRSEELENSLGRLAESHRRLAVLTREVEEIRLAARQAMSVVAK
jgi:hypothetical protein